MKILVLLTCFILGVVTITKMDAPPHCIAGTDFLRKMYDMANCTQIDESIMITRPLTPKEILFLIKTPFALKTLNGNMEIRNTNLRNFGKILNNVVVLKGTITIDSPFFVAKKIWKKSITIGSLHIRRQAPECLDMTYFKPIDGGKIGTVKLYGPCKVCSGSLTIEKNDFLPFGIVNITGALMIKDNDDDENFKNLRSLLFVKELEIHDSPGFVDASVLNPLLSVKNIINIYSNPNLVNIDTLLKRENFLNVFSNEKLCLLGNNNINMLNSMRNNSTVKHDRSKCDHICEANGVLATTLQTMKKNSKCTVIHGDLMIDQLTSKSSKSDLNVLHRITELYYGTLIIRNNEEDVEFDFLKNIRIIRAPPYICGNESTHRPAVRVSNNSSPIKLYANEITSISKSRVIFDDDKSILSQWKFKHNDTTIDEGDYIDYTTMAEGETETSTAQLVRASTVLSEESPYEIESIYFYLICISIFTTLTLLVALNIFLSFKAYRLYKQHSKNKTVSPSSDSKATPKLKFSSATKTSRNSMRPNPLDSQTESADVIPK